MQEHPSTGHEKVTGKLPGTQAACGSVSVALPDFSAVSDPLSVNSALISVTINKRQWLVLLDTGSEGGLVSEIATQRCNLPVHLLALSL